MANVYSIEEAVRNWLVDMNYDAYVRVPKARPQPFLTVERTGGNVADMVDHPTFAVQAWADTEPEAEEMLLEIRELLVTGDVPSGFYRVEAESYYPWFDDSTRLPRYQLVLNCTTQLTK